MDLYTLTGQHQEDFPGLRVFTAYSAALPIHRLNASLLVREANDVDPIDLFLLRGLNNGLTNVGQLSSFFGLDSWDIEVSLAGMLRNEWVTAHRASPADDAEVSLTQTGRDVLDKQLAFVQQTREEEIWVDGLTGTCEVRTPRRRLQQRKDARAQGLFLMKELSPKPKVAGDIDFNALQLSVARLGSEIWPGTRLNQLLDVLSFVSRGMAYRVVDVIVFQSPDGQEIAFEVFDAGVRRDDYERLLKRLETDENVEVVPTEPPPPESDVAQFEAQLSQVIAQEPPIREKASDSNVTGAQRDNAEKGSSTDTRDRLREAEQKVRELQEIVDTQDFIRNEENRQIWIDVLNHFATSYVVMEFPWLRREALDAEILAAMERALRRGVQLWLTWGMNVQEESDARNRAVVTDLQALSRLATPGSLHIHFRGDTHCKVLLWDRKKAVIGSFNFGSFRGDPKRTVIQQLSAVLSSPRKVRELESDYRALFGVESLATDRLTTQR